ncbi:hypothetical protein Klosneuvirus_3_76 [Klosneuvirus KNV1]|uniref:Uncharacterized protein n=1 Tax=Klosneuvirus KNV1 TaxID=1977640 RepID=A0A1V0SJU9_9VIRU|nr:hypothetical protein Klosneuvirus_3_76 [Klosneuvirus KNV1]
MSTPDNKNQNQFGDKAGLSIFSAIFYCISMIFLIAAILTLVKYSMAASALSSGDIRSAAAIMSEGQPTHVYGPSYSPSHGRYGHNTSSYQKPWF